MDEILRIQMFGNLRLSWGDGEPVAVESIRLQSLLAYLVLHRGTPQPRAYLAFLLWPDSDETQALTNLRNLLTRLRLLSPGLERYLNASRTTVSWRVALPSWLDVQELETIAGAPLAVDGVARALALYTEPLVPACYDEWIQPIRDRLARAFEQLLDSAIPMLEGQRDYPAALRCAQRRLELDPLHEPAYARLMELYAATGNRNAALRTYKRCSEVLEREMQLAPGAELKALYQRLLKHETPASTAPGDAIFVGRTAEWAQLTASWRAASSGRPRVVTVVGEGGLGKTRLLEELAGWVKRQGVCVAAARCYSAEGHLAFAPVTMLLRSCMPRQLAPVWRSELARLLPELEDGETRLPRPAASSEPWKRQRFFEALARALLASQPLLVVVDDLQWCDQDSLEWLHFLIRFDRAAKLLIVASMRSEEVTQEHALSRTLQALAREQLIETLPLPPLTAPDSAKLAAAIGGGQLPPEAERWLFQQSEGNSLYIVEMVRAGLHKRLGNPEQPLPSTMEAVLGTRFGLLSSEARALAELAATCGRAFSSRLLAAAGRLESAVVADLLDELEQRRIIQARGGVYDFTHGMLRRFLYERIRSARRTVLHLQIARALQLETHGRRPGRSGEIAYHYERAGEIEQAAERYVAAGDEALQAYALHDAILLYANALRCQPPSERVDLRWAALRGREEAFGLLGSIEAQLEDLGVMERLASLEKNDGWRADVRVRRSRVAYAQGNPALGNELAASAQALAHRAGDARLEALAWNCRALSLYLLEPADVSPVIEAESQALALAKQAGDATLECLVLGELSEAYSMNGQPAEALSFADQAMALSRRIEDTRSEAQSRGARAYALGRLRRYGEARQELTEAARLAQEIGLRFDASRYLGYLGYTCFRLKDFSRALQHLDEAVEISRALGNRADEASWLSKRGVTWGALGIEPRARTDLQQALGIARDLSLVWFEAMTLVRLSILEVELERPALALERLEQAESLRSELQDHAFHFGLLRARGLIDAALGRTAEAAGTLRQALSTGRGFGAVSESVLCEPCAVELAEVLITCEDLEGARQLLEPIVIEGAAGVEGDVCPQRALFASSRLLAASGEETGAKERLEQAVRLILEAAERLEPAHREGYLQHPINREILNACARHGIVLPSGLR